MVAIERRERGVVRILNNCIYVDQKELLRLRIELHCALHRFIKDVNAFLALPGGQEFTICKISDAALAAAPQLSNQNSAWADSFPDEDETGAGSDAEEGEGA